MFLRKLKGFGPVKINSEYLPRLTDIDNVDRLADYVARREGKLSDAEIEKALQESQSIYDRVAKDIRVKVITVFDDEYPARFDKLGTKKPSILYVKGDMDVLYSKSISVIGTREPSERTLQAGAAMVKIIVEKYGYTVVSGLALGCDGLAHRTAIDCGGKTVAVLPGGVNKIAPPAHEQLAADISGGAGCLLSEYDPDEIASKYNFVRRDTLVAALSAGTLALECRVKSGTMHTVDDAYSLQKPIACYMPDGAGESFAGNRYILSERGGAPIVKHSDLWEFMEKLE